MIGKRSSATGPACHLMPSPLFASFLVVNLLVTAAIVPAQAQSRYTDWLEIAVDEELGDELPADHPLYEESVGESAEDADVEGEPAAGERPDPPLDDSGDRPDGEAGSDPASDGSSD